MGHGAACIIAFSHNKWGAAVIFQRYAVVAVVLIIASSLGLLLSRTWRQSIISLAIQYIAVFWLASLTWPVGLAAVKLVVGWMCGAVLGASQLTGDLTDDDFIDSSGLLFRFLTAGVVWAGIFAMSSVMATWIPARLPILQGGMILISGGLLQLGMTKRPMRAVIGLLSLLAGFEIIYSSLETSVLVAGLLAMINLALAMVGSYLLSGVEYEATV